MDLRGIVKAATAGISVLASMVLLANVEQAVRGTGADSLLLGFLEDHASSLTGLIQSPWCRFGSVAVIAFAAGLCADSLLAKLPGRSGQFRSLGAESVMLAQFSRNAARSYVRTDAAPLLAKIGSMFIRLEKLGFSLPQISATLSVNDKLEIAAAYLLPVGQLLLDGHRKEAESLAATMSAQDMEGQLRAAQTDRDERF